MERNVVVIDEVDSVSQTVSVTDARGGKFTISLGTTSGSYLMPKQGESWLAERNDYQWDLAERFESNDDRIGISDLNPGDNRILATNKVRVSAPAILFNDVPVGAVTWDRFEIPEQGLTTITLSNVPLSIRSVMAFSNGRLLDPALLLLSHDVLVGKNIRFAHGILVVYYNYTP
jgi:hypothetical protein